MLPFDVAVGGAWLCSTQWVADYASAATTYDWEKSNLPPSQKIPGYATGLARLKLDRFASINGGEKAGRLVTRPLGFSGTRLHINAQTARGVEIRVGLQTWDGKAIKGFGAGDCKPIRGNRSESPSAGGAGRTSAPCPSRTSASSFT